MGRTVRLVDGHIVYDGLLSSKEKATIDEILIALREEIPSIESDLESEYGQNILYKYYLGLFLGDLLEKYNILFSERRRFWDEIKNFATNEERKRDEGKNAVTRSFYHQCYILSQQEIEVVKKLSWRQWQDILDRVSNREDPRIFKWLKQYPDKIREDDWREFEKALHMYLRDKDTSVFELNELFAIYDSIMLMCRKWRELFKDFSAQHPKSGKIKTKGTWAKKYYALCITMKKEKRSKIILEDTCNKAFAILMKL